MPSVRTSDRAVPEPAVPEPAVPEPAVPEPAAPEPAVPEPVVPERALGEATRPEPGLPDPAVLARAAAGARGRVTRLEQDGRVYWVKREERLTLRLRLLKGPGASAFVREREGLRRLAAAGAPVPPILAEGPEFFVVPDCGVPLRRMLRHGLGTGAERCAAFAAAGRALAELHSAGLSHGNPRLKDICWQPGEGQPGEGEGGRITFIDLECAEAARDTAAGHAYDLGVFVFNAIAEAGGPTPELEAACAAYRAAAPDGIWEAAAARVARLRLLGWLTWPLRFRRGERAREFKAIPLAMAYFRQG